MVSAAIEESRAKIGKFLLHNDQRSQLCSHVRRFSVLSFPLIQTYSKEASLATVKLKDVSCIQGCWRQSKRNETMQDTQQRLIKHLIKGMTPLVGARRLILPPARKNQRIDFILLDCLTLEMFFLVIKLLIFLIKLFFTYKSPWNFQQTSV